MSKSGIISGMTFGTEFISELVKGLRKRGVNDEQIHAALKSNSAFISDVADSVAAFIAKVLCPLTHLKIAVENIAVTTAAFSKDDFFASKLGVKLHLWDNFKTWVAPKVSFIVPAFISKLTSYTLGKSMYDAEIRAEIGEDQVFSVDEFTAVIEGLTAKQAKGEVGDLLTNGYANIFYVRLDENTVVAVYAYWFAGDRGWDLDANRLERGEWVAGRQVFVRS